MKALIYKMGREDDGVLSFEWVLLVTLLTIGVVGGLAAVRDAIIDELGDFSQAALALDESYTITNPLAVHVHELNAESGAGNTAFTDAAFYEDCTRVTTGSVVQQQDQLDVDS